MSEMVRALAERAGPQGLKPRSSAGCCGTAEAVPLSETVGMSATAGEEQMPGFFAPLRMTNLKGQNDNFEGEWQKAAGPGVTEST